MTGMKRIRKTLLPPALLLLAVWPGCADPHSLKDSNVIIVLVDTLRRDRLGAQSAAGPTSPCMDRLAGEGVSFEHAVAPSSWTKPSVASLMTGLYARTHGAVRVTRADETSRMKGSTSLSSKHVTMAETLREAGYRTAAFVTNPNIIPALNFDQGFDLFVQPAGDAGALIQQSLDWIEASGKEDKFHLYLHLIDPHFPYFPPKEYRERFAPGVRGAGALLALEATAVVIHSWLNQFTQWKPENPTDRFRFDFDKAKTLIQKTMPDMASRLDLDKLRSELDLDFQGKDDPALIRQTDYLISLYDGEVAYSDHAIRRLMDGLEENKILDHTIVVVTADHGESFLEHYTWGHRHSVFGEEVDVPLIFRIPGSDGTFKGAFHETVSLVDVFPTLLDMLEMEIPGPVEGISLWPAIERADSNLLPARPVFTELIIDQQDHAAVLMGRKKLIRSQAPDNRVKWMYYDLESDPLEQAPLDPEGHDELGKKLQKLLDEYIRKRDLPFGEEKGLDSLTEEEIKQMQALGYI
jgi:arylsulfatase A-like enzyme